MLSWLREQLDKILLSDHEWKKKYCPNIHNWLFVLTPEQRHAWFVEHCARVHTIASKVTATKVDTVDSRLTTINMGDEIEVKSAPDVSSLS